MASGFLRAVVLLIVAAGVGVGVGVALVEAHSHHTARGIGVGVAILVGAAFQAALLWLFVEMHGDVAAMRSDLGDLTPRGAWHTR